jgi:hypothetical protein
MNQKSHYIPASLCATRDCLPRWWVATPPSEESPDSGLDVGLDAIYSHVAIG